MLQNKKEKGGLYNLAKPQKSIRGGVINLPNAAAANKNLCTKKQKHIHRAVQESHSLCMCLRFLLCNGGMVHHIQYGLLL